MPARFPLPTSLTFALTLFLASSTTAQDGLAILTAVEGRITEVTQQAERSVVAISRIRPQPIGNFGDEAADRMRPDHPDFVPNDFGSGVVIAGGGGEPVVLTNYHVVRGGPTVTPQANAPEGRPMRLYVRFADGRGGDAEIYAADPRSDLAILKVDARAIEGVPPLKFSEAETFAKGRFVLLLGNPYAVAKDGSASVGFGLIANRLRRPAPLPHAPFDSATRKQETLHHLGTLLQIDARINLGHSGGAVLNLKGELIGMTTSLAAVDGYEQSAGFAVPFDEGVRKIVTDLAAGLEPEYGFLGVTPSDTKLTSDLQLRGGHPFRTAPVATTVIPGSPAHDAGMRRGDVILQVGRVEVNGTYALMREVSTQGPTRSDDMPVPVRLYRPREDRFRVASVRLDKWPVQDEEGLITARERYPTWTGLRIEDATGRNRHFDRSTGLLPSGVLILGTSDSSPLADIVREGDRITHVNGVRVADPEQFAKTLPQSGEVTLSIAGREPIVLTDASGIWAVRAAGE